jgi:hypothetical protein
LGLISPEQALKIRSAWLSRILAAVAVLLVRTLFRTLRIQASEFDPRTNPYRGGSQAVIYCVWHDAILVPLFAGRHRRTVALVSRHRDGSFLAHSMQRLGIGLVRGSSSRGGASAVRQMLSLPADKHIVMTPDGPRGPRRRIKLGPVFLASQSGRAIVPTAFAATRSWKLPGTWTDLLIPKPFTTVYALTGQPIAIGPNLSRAELVAAERVVQAAMDALGERAERLAKGHACRRGPAIKAALISGAAAAARMQ